MVYEISICKTQPNVGTVVCRSRVRHIRALKLEILNPKSSAPVILVNLIPVFHPSCCAYEGVFEGLWFSGQLLLACWVAPGGTFNTYKIIILALDIRVRGSFQESGTVQVQSRH